MGLFTIRIPVKHNYCPKPLGLDVLLERQILAAHGGGGLLFAVIVAIKGLEQRAKFLAHKH